MILLSMPVRWSNAYRTARNTNVSRRMARDDVSAERSSRRGLKMGYRSMVAGWSVIAAMFACQFDVVNKVNSTLSLKSIPRKTAPSFQLSQRQNYFRHKIRRYQDTGQLIGRIKPCRLQISPQSTPIRQGGGRFDGSRPVPPLLTFCAGFAGWVGVGHTCAGKMYSFCRHRGESLKKQA